MSLLELLFRFGVVAAIFAGAMVLLRRYGRTRVRQAEENHGLLVTSRLTVGRGVQLLLVKAGRKTFLVSSGGRVSMTPLDLPTASLPSAAGDGAGPAAAATAGAMSSSVASSPAQDSAPAGEPSQGTSAPPRQAPWAQRVGASLGAAIRQRVSSRSSANDVTAPADFAAHLEAASQRAAEGEEAPRVDVPETHEEPVRVLDAQEASLHEARIDVDTATVVIPRLPAAPRSSSAVSRAAREEAAPKAPAPKRRSTKSPTAPKKSSPTGIQEEVPQEAPSEPRKRASRTKGAQRRSATSDQSSAPHPGGTTDKTPTTLPATESAAASQGRAETGTPAGSRPTRKTARALTRAGRKGSVVELSAPSLPASGPSAPLTPAASLQLAATPAKIPTPALPTQEVLLG